MAITASRSSDRRGPRAERLDLPDAGRAVVPFPRVDRESVSRVAEAIARFLGTGRYLAIQTGVVIVWIGLNIAVPLMRWDPYPFILLNLAFSTQAAYAAPLILLAQNRQDDRDRAALTEDRAVAGRMREDTEFLTREVAALRLAQSEAATRQYVRGELAGQLESLRGDLESLLLEAIRSSLATAPGTPVPAAALAAGTPTAGRGTSRGRGNVAGLAPEAAGASAARAGKRAKSARRPRAVLATAELEAAAPAQLEDDADILPSPRHPRYASEGRQNSPKRVIRPQRIPTHDTSDDCLHRRGPNQ